MRSFCPRVGGARVSPLAGPLAHALLLKCPEARCVCVRRSRFEVDSRCLVVTNRSRRESNDNRIDSVIARKCGSIDRIDRLYLEVWGCAQPRAHTNTTTHNKRKTKKRSKKTKKKRLCVVRQCCHLQLFML